MRRVEEGEKAGGGRGAESRERGFGSEQAAGTGTSVTARHEKSITVLSHEKSITLSRPL